MSISHLYPEEGPTLNLNFAGSRTLDPRITFTRTSTATVMGREGLIEVVPANTPRFDHRYNPTTGEIESLGLLVEELRSNLVKYSNIEGTIGAKPTNFEFASSAVGQSCEVSTDFDIDGNGKCVKHIRGESGDNNVGYTFGYTLTTDKTYSFSVYVYIPSSQKNNITSIRFGPDNGFSTVTYGYADLNIVDRWQRVVGSFVSSGGGGVLCRANASNGAFFYTDAWQLEEGSFPTSYIPTSGSTATRTADNASMTGSNFSSWFNQGDGTFLINGSAPYQFQRSFGVSAFNTATVNDNRLSIRMGNTFMRTNAVEQFGFYQQQSTNSYKVAVAYGTNTASQVLNTVIAGTDTSVITPSNYDVMEIGKVESNTSLYTNGAISQLIYYPTRLPNSTLQALTR